MIKDYIAGIFREMYRLPNGKIYIKYDKTPTQQLHLQIDFSDLPRIRDDCARIFLGKDKENDQE